MQLIGRCGRPSCSPGTRAQQDHVIRAIHGMRLAELELARRPGSEAGPTSLTDLWLLKFDELRDYVAGPAGLQRVLAERRALHDKLAALVPPFVFEGTQPSLDTWARRDKRRSPRWRRAPS